MELRPASTGHSQALWRRIDSLVLERQRLREHHLPDVALEQNRLELVRAQLAYSRALVSEHADAAPNSSAA